MQQPEMTLEKQRKMILRCIADLEDNSHLAFNNQDVQHFYALETASERFKEFVREHITIPQIKAAIEDIPAIEEQPESGLGGRAGIFGAMYSIFAGKEESRPNATTIKTAHVMIAHYQEMKRFVREME